MTTPRGTAAQTLAVRAAAPLTDRPTDRGMRYGRRTASEPVRMVAGGHEQSAGQVGADSFVIERLLGGEIGRVSSAICVARR